MANSLASAFGSSSGGWASSLSPATHYAPIKPIKKKKGHKGSLIGHFLSDVRDAATGLPMGLVKLGGAVGAAAHGNFDPIEKMGSEMFHSYGYMYGPAFHGHLGTTLHRMGQHPLQPLLDAVSIVTAPVAGLGVGVKAADSAMMFGARIGVVSAERATQATRAGNFFRTSTRYVHEMQGEPGGVEVISSNPSVRQIKQLRFGTAHLLAKAMPNSFGSNGKIMDFTREGVDARIQKRYLKGKRGEREHAAAAMFARELNSAKDLFKNPNLSAHDIAGVLEGTMRDVVITHAFSLAPTELKNFAPPTFISALNRTGKYAGVKPKITSARGELADGWQFIDRKHRYSEYPRDKTVAEFGRWITGKAEDPSSKGFAQSMLTNKIGSAMRDKNGNYLVVRTRAIEEIQEEAGRAHKALRILFDNPTKVWKWAVLATAPRYFVNNVIGNGIMYGMAANPIDTSRALFTSIQQMHGQKAAMKALSEVEAAQRKIIGDWVDKWYSGATEGFGHEVTRDMTLHKRFSNDIARGAVRRVEGGLFSVTQFVSDSIPRRALVNLFVRKEPKYIEEFRRLRSVGVDSKVAHQQAADAASSFASVRTSVVKKVDNVMGQYHTFNRTEKAVKRVIPFYSWDRAIARHAFHLAAEKPVVAQTIAQLGYQGIAETQHVLGDIPDFMKGVIPLDRIGITGTGILGFLIGDHGRDAVLSTQGLNPYATLPDVLDFASTLVQGNPKAGEALAGQLNPIITGAIQHYTGQSLMSGRSLPQGNKGLLADVTESVALATPTVRLIQTAIKGAPQPKLTKSGIVRSPFLYKGDLKQQASSYFGAPIKQVSKSKAHELFRRQEGITLPKTRKKAYKPVGLKGFTHRKSTRGRIRKPRLPRPRVPTY